MKRLKIKELCLLGIWTGFFFLPCVVVWADDAPAVSEAEAPAPPKTELDRLKTEWEAVREQQVQMIREKEDQLEKLKEEIFSKMKTQDGPVASDDKAAGDAQKAALQADRQKFFAEMSRQKESLRQLQSSLDEKAKQLEIDRDRFEREKKTVAR